MFVAPAELQRFAPKRVLRVVEVAVGTGTNTAALLEAAHDLDLELDWWGLEQDPAPLQLSLADRGFQQQWRPGTLERLMQLASGPRLLWGDARLRIGALLQGSPDPSAPGRGGRGGMAGRCDLVLLDAFSPQRCPQLWSLEFLSQLARLLAPDGRLLSYCSAAAVRRSLQLCDLELAAIRPAAMAPADRWSAGTAASPSPLPESPWLRPLLPMEREHIACRAGEPYRDPSGCGSAATLLAERRHRQAVSGDEPAGAWQRRWGTSRRHRRERSAEGGPGGRE